MPRCTFAGFEGALLRTNHKNATGLLRSASGFPPHPPCCAVILTDKQRSKYECAPDGRRSLVDVEAEKPAVRPEEPAAVPAAHAPAHHGNASNRAAWVARIEGAAAQHIVDAGGDVFDTVPASGFPLPEFSNPCWCVISSAPREDCSIA